MKYLYNPPYLFKYLFNSFHWNTTNGKLLLTFDDGPVPGNTERILNELEQKNIKALFFCVGNNINKNPELARIILSKGHTIGNHTYNHRKIIGLTNEEKDKEIESVSTLLKREFNYSVRYFRPPYGKFNLSTPKYLKQRNLECVVWSLITYDYKNNLDIVKFAVEKYLRKDSIVLLHDNLKCKDIVVDSIQFIINEAEKKGFCFGEPAECLR